MVKASTDADIPLLHPTISAPPHHNSNIPSLLLEVLPVGHVNVVAEVARLKLGLRVVERRRRQLRCRLVAAATEAAYSQRSRSSDRRAP